jgi:hypothetical protein
LELTTISSNRSEQAIKVGKVIYLPELPEYPKTLEEGVAYLINIENIPGKDIDLICENVYKTFSNIFIIY